MVLADGDGSEEGSRFVGELRDHLGLSDDFAAAVVAVMAAKNRG